MELVFDAILHITDAEELVEMAQHRDEKLNDVREYLISKTLPTREQRYAIWVKNLAEKCFLENDLVWYKSERIGRRDIALLVVPEHLRERIIQAAHLAREAGHGGIHRTTERIQLSYWWPALKQDVDNFIKKYERYQTSKTPMPAKAPLQSLPNCSEPNERIHIDLFTDMRQRSGAKHICVMTDAFSKYTEMVCIESKFADVVARAFFERWICRFSVPKLLMSDQGREFDNKVMDELCLIFGVKKKRTSPYHPETNAQAEVYYKTIIKYMKAQLDNDTTLDWEEHIPALALAYNSHVHSLTRETPFYLTYLHDPRLPWFDLEKPRAF
jgi:transposase InsO family protein